MDRRTLLTGPDYDALLAAVEALAARGPKAPGVLEVVRHAARELTGADGASVVVREGDRVHYVAEDAIGPLWKGQRFPVKSCVSGWAIEHKRPAIIEDIYADARVPVEAYRHTFVKSLAIVPAGLPDPLGALGAYWARRHAPTDREVYLLQRLAAAMASALAAAEEERHSVEAIQVREAMIDAAAHDLRNALNTVMLRTASLRPLIEEREQPRLSSGFGRLENLVADAAKLVTSLLDAARVGSGTLQLEYEEVDLVQIIAAVLERLQEELQNSGSHLVVGGASELHGHWDRLRLEQVVTNLLSNAIKYGRGKPIGVQVEDRPSSAQLTVSDGGLGIAEDDKAHIFERFGRGKGAGSVPGMGLGLWIVHHLVRAHGGEVTVDTRPGEGARFTVRLPKYLTELGVARGSQND